MNPCEVCGFQLYHPVQSLEVSEWGLYDDARFPGRSIISLKQHHTYEEQVPSHLLSQFLTEIQLAAKAIKASTGCERVNIALLGNTVHHVHAHLIPRKPENEPNPHKSPWDDDRSKTSLSPAELNRLISKLRYQATLLNPRNYEVTRSVTYNCKHCGWNVTKPENEEENAHQEWVEHYEESCCCVSYNCQQPRVSLSQLCHFHDVHGEDYIEGFVV